MSNNISTRRKNSSLPANQIRETGNAENIRDQIAKSVAVAKTLEANTLFPLGDIIVTANAQRTLSQDEMTEALTKHATGDWSAMCEDDRHQNELALDQGRQIFSAFDNTKRAFWIISHADRSATTILLPIDYWKLDEMQSHY